MNISQRRNLPTGSNEFVCFGVSGLNCGLRVKNVTEIVKPAEIPRIENVPRGLLGFWNHRSHMIPVVSLAELFRQPSTAKTGFWVVACDLENKRICLNVDIVYGVFALHSALKENMSKFSAVEVIDFSSQVYVFRDELLFALSLEKIERKYQRVEHVVG